MKINLLKKLKFSRIKNISFFLLICFSTVSIASFIALFYGSNLKNSNQDNENNNTLETDYLYLNFSEKDINKTNIKNMVIFKDNFGYIFDKSLINNNLGNFIDQLLTKNINFTDNINDYLKVVKYQISDDKKSLIINLFLYNRLLKIRRFKSFFQINIK